MTRTSLVGTAERRMVEEGEVSVIDGVRWTSDTIPGVEIAWGDPVDLPLGDETSALVLLHVPRYDELGRYHQPNAEEYLGWLDEVIDDAGRVLERGGRLVLVVKAPERRHPWLDLPTLLVDPLHRAGFHKPNHLHLVPNRGHRPRARDWPARWGRPHRGSAPGAGPLVAGAGRRQGPRSPGRPIVCLR